MFTMQEKLAFIEAWKSSGLTQDEYCAAQRDQGGPSPRCLRTWMATLVKPQGVCAEARAIVARAVGDLQALLLALDAVQGEQVTVAARADGKDDGVPAAAPCRTAGADANSDASEPAAAECRAATDAESHQQSDTLLPDLVMKFGEAAPEVSPGVGDDAGLAAPPVPAVPRRKSFFDF